MQKNNINFSKDYILHILMYFFFFSSRIIFTGLMSILLFDKGFSAYTISLVSSISILVSLALVPYLGHLCDKKGPEKVSIFLLLVASISGVAFACSSSLILIITFFSGVMLSINVLHPIIEKKATTTAYSYGSIRIWGTLGHAFGTQIGGICYQHISSESAYILFSFGLMITLFSMRSIAKYNTNSPDSHKNIYWGLNGMITKELIAYTAIVFCFYAALDSKNLFITPFFNSVGFSITSTSSLLFAASFFEIPLIIFGNKFINTYSRRKLVTSAIIILLCQLLCYAFFSNQVLLIIITLLSNSFTSMLFIMINLRVISELIDASKQITVLTAISSVRSISAVFGQTLGGKIIDIYSYQFFFMFLILLATLSVILAVSFMDNTPTLKGR